MSTNLLPDSKIVFEYDIHKIILLPPSVERLSQLLEALNESKDSLCRFMPWALDESTYEEKPCLELIAEHHKDYWQGNNIQFDIIDFDTDNYLGRIGLKNTTMNNLHKEIGYWIRTSVQGRGIMTVATKAIIAYGFHRKNLQIVNLKCSLENIASKRIAEKSDMKLHTILPFYHEKPTEKMTQSGFTTSQDSYLFILERSKAIGLNWYQELTAKLKIWNHQNQLINS